MPRQEALLAVVVLQAEDIGVYRQQVATALINHLACIFSSLIQVILVAAAAHAVAGLGEIHLREEPVG